MWHDHYFLHLETFAESTQNKQAKHIKHTQRTPTSSSNNQVNQVDMILLHPIISNELCAVSVPFRVTWPAWLVTWPLPSVSNPLRRCRKILGCGWIHWRKPYRSSEGRNGQFYKKNIKTWNHQTKYVKNTNKQKQTKTTCRLWCPFVVVKW